MNPRGGMVNSILLGICSRTYVDKEYFIVYYRMYIHHATHD